MTQLGLPRAQLWSGAVCALHPRSWPGLWSRLDVPRASLFLPHLPNTVLQDCSQTPTGCSLIVAPSSCKDAWDFFCVLHSVAAPLGSLSSSPESDGVRGEVFGLAELARPLLAKCKNCMASWPFVVLCLQLELRKYSWLFAE